MNRRTFLSMAAGALSLGSAQASGSIPIIDTHIHLFDPRRPQGIPWPDKSDIALYRPALPSRYRSVTRGLGIVGALEVECSPWLEDNQWVLDVAARDSIIVGTVGDLAAGERGFAKNLERFHRNPLFRGIRYGNLWGRNLGAQLSRPDFISDLKRLADAGLELDSANPDPELISDLVRLTDKVPSLRVVIDHLPHLEPPADALARARYESDLKELGSRPQVFVKVSEVLRRVGAKVPFDLSYYRSVLDVMWETFGEDRLIYGSDWPNSDHLAPYEKELAVVSEYFAGKGRRAAEKFFWKNSIAAYRWIKRDEKQTQLG